MATLYWPFDISTVSEWPGGVSGIRDGVHMGTDFAVPQGTVLLATTTGQVRTYTGVGGNGVDITSDDGLVVRNWHLSQFNVSNGDFVEAGQLIGLTGGARGTWGAGNSTGPHLHWEIRTNRNFSQNGWLDPRPLNPATFGQDNNQRPRRKTMATMYFVTRNGKTTFALAGDGNGEAAWLETEQQDFANKLAAIHGSAIQLSPDTWNLWRSKYLDK